MARMTRRGFLGASAAMAGLAVSGKGFAADPAKRFRMGAQSYSFRNFDFEGAIAQLKALGLTEMEFYSGHIPVNHEDEDFPKVKAAIEEAGISVPCFGVEGFTRSENINRRKFDFAKALGVEILTANPTEDSFDNLEALCEEYGVKIAIHNHGPGARYDKVQDTLDAVAGRNPMIGACLDTGHAIRSGEAPHEVAEKLGDRLISLHLKDWRHGAEEAIVGEGDMDLKALVRVLKGLDFDGPIMLEYEESPDDPVPDMRIGLQHWHDAVAEVMGA